MFWVEMKGIPSFVSTHLTRHKIGVEHFVQTMRDDRGAEEVADRNTPVNHAMFINAQALINMSRKRLCKKASIETRAVMRAIMHAVDKVDTDLFNYMMPDCMYRNKCYEISPCGWYYK
jgi:thymidylate synthase ThyX